MSCNEYEMMINRMVDGETTGDDSRAVFSHLASCGACRTFYHQLQSLGTSLELIAADLKIPGEDSQHRRHMYVDTPRHWWVRQVPLRAPVFGLLVLALLISLYFSFSSALQVRQPEIVYITKLPPITVTAEAVPINFMKRGVQQ